MSLFSADDQAMLDDLRSMYYTVYADRIEELLVELDQWEQFASETMEWDGGFDD